MMSDVLALAVVAKAAKISSMVDSCGMIEKRDGVSVRWFPNLLTCDEQCLMMTYEPLVTSYLCLRNVCSSTKD